MDKILFINYNFYRGDYDMKLKLLIISMALFILTGCQSNSNVDNTSESDNSSQTEMFTSRDYETDYDDENSIHITFNGSEVSTDSNSVTIDDNTLTITEEGTYVFSGSWDDGTIIIDSEDSKIHLVFNGVEIYSQTSSALYIKEADKVFLTLNEDSENTLSNSGEYEAIDENNIDGVIFSKQDLTINGSGCLTIDSPGGHGIVCNDDLVFTGGNINVTASNQGLKANDSIRITNTILTINAGKDGIHAQNDDDDTSGFIYIESGTFNLETQGDGISAGYTLEIVDGSFDLLCGGGYENGSSSSSENWGTYPGNSDNRFQQRNQNTPGGITYNSVTYTTSSNSDSTSMKGLKADGDIILHDGEYVIDSADDAIHSNASITIKGGTYQVSSGDDGIHADETLTFEDGTLTIDQSYEGMEAVNIYINSGDISIYAEDDGINGAGGSDQSGITGGRDGMFNESMSDEQASIEINGSTINIVAYGDGIDSNGTLTINDGNISIFGPNSGDTSIIDYEVSGTINGGTFAGSGSTSMFQSFSNSSQGIIVLRINSQNAETYSISDANGNTIIEVSPTLEYSVILVSSEDIISGQSYTVTVGGTSSTVQAS